MALACNKFQLSQMYGLSTRTLRVLMNVHYFDDLQAVGYRKNMKILPPKVIEKFKEIYGEPLKDD